MLINQMIRTPRHDRLGPTSRLGAPPALECPGCRAERGSTWLSVFAEACRTPHRRLPLARAEPVLPTYGGFGRIAAGLCFASYRARDDGHLVGWPGRSFGTVELRAFSAGNRRYPQMVRATDFPRAAFVAVEHRDVDAVTSTLSPVGADLRRAGKLAPGAGLIERELRTAQTPGRLQHSDEALIPLSFGLVNVHARKIDELPVRPIADFSVPATGMAPSSRSRTGSDVALSRTGAMRLMGRPPRVTTPRARRGERTKGS